MDIYSVSKFLHIAAAIAWIGGGITLFAMATFAGRRNDTEELLRIARNVGELANRWFIPSALLTLLFGIVMTVVGNLWSQAWIVLGLIGFAATFVTGHFVMRPKALELGRLVGEGKTEEAAAVSQGLFGVSRFDYVMLFSVVALMVLKPSWPDFVTLAVLAVILAGAAVLFILPRRSREAIAPAE